MKPREMKDAWPYEYMLDSLNENQWSGSLNSFVDFVAA